MRRYWIPKSSASMEHLLIEGDEFHHIFHVCRQQEGSRFEVLTEDGHALFVQVETMEKKRAAVKVLESRQLARLPKPHLHLCLSLPKIDTLEKVLEKSVELGVKSLRPFSSDFSFVKSSKKIVSQKHERFQRIIKGATQQTGRGDLMELPPLSDLQSLLEQCREQDGVPLFAYEGDGQSSVKEALKSSSDSKDIWLFVGSEGGFSEREVQLFQQLGAPPVSLGDQVLRVETACVTLLGIIKYELGQF